MNLIQLEAIALTIALLKYLLNDFFLYWWNAISAFASRPYDRGKLPSEPDHCEILFGSTWVGVSVYYVLDFSTRRNGVHILYENGEIEVLNYKSWGELRKRTIGK